MKSKLFIFFTGCSFDSKSGIWDGVKKEKKRLLAIEKKQASGDNTRVYSSNTYFSEEVIPSSEVNLSEAKKNSFWKMNGLNLQNSTGNSYLTGIQNRFLKKKIGVAIDGLIDGWITIERLTDQDRSIDGSIDSDWMHSTVRVCLV